MEQQSFWEKFFSFSGRLNRLTYFLRGLVLGLIGFGVALIIVFLVMGMAGAGMGILALPLILVAIVLGVAIFVGSLSLVVRRLHDMNLSGLWYLVVVG